MFYIYPHEGNARAGGHSGAFDSSGEGSGDNGHLVTSSALQPREKVVYRDVQALQDGAVGVEAAEALGYLSRCCRTGSPGR